MSVLSTAIRGVLPDFVGRFVPTQNGYIVAVAAGISTAVYMFCKSFIQRGTQVNNSLVVVTGASSGVGEATARLMAAKGASVILLARSENRLKQITDDIISRGGRAVYYVVDLGDIDASLRVVAEIKSHNGVPDIIVNSAGLGEWKWPEDTTPLEAVSMMQAPYFAAFNTTTGFLREMIQRQHGHVVNINSPACYACWPGATAYIGARRALKGFDDALFMDTYGTGVHVSHITFGYVNSPYWDNNQMSNGGAQRLPAVTNLFRPFLSPSDCAQVIVKTVERGDREVISPFTMWLAVKFYGGPIKWLIESLILATRIQRTATVG
eukprot:TRINITY_DN5715_c0_g2_i1.p1 TRINITY_DN5715_c0_g2~~TRINITY_DN5715_c0_g2_i1.p1  ORF type:complete len:343 (-),score=-47.47 TRINITY_DN5715_c0_g2_i1:231-1199(-)